jgi:hypothetical protein
MTPATSTPRTYTLDDIIAWKDRTGEIAPPFSPDERSLAQAVAEAWHFVHWLTELPARAPDQSRAFAAMCMGVWRVIEHREGRW